MMPVCASCQFIAREENLKSACFPCDSSVKLDCVTVAHRLVFREEHKVCVIKIMITKSGYSVSYPSLKETFPCEMGLFASRSPTDSANLNSLSEKLFTNGEKCIVSLMEYCYTV